MLLKRQILTRKDKSKLLNISNFSNWSYQVMFIFLNLERHVSIHLLCDFINWKCIQDSGSLQSFDERDQTIAGKNWSLNIPVSGKL